MSSPTPIVSGLRQPSFEDKSIDSNEGSGKDSDSIISFITDSSSGSSDYRLTPDDEPAVDERATDDEPEIIVEVDAIRSPIRKSKTRSVEVHSPMKHVASSEKVRRNSDSMLEDAFVADKLKRRLASRREQATNRRTIAYTGLSDFIMKSIMEGSLDAISAVLPTDKSLSNVANAAFHACMAGYFDNLKDEIVIQKVKNLFTDSLERVEFQRGEYICKQNSRVERKWLESQGWDPFLASCRWCTAFQLLLTSNASRHVSFYGRWIRCPTVEYKP
jgi:hypothetical protein